MSVRARRIPTHFGLAGLGLVLALGAGCGKEKANIYSVLRNFDQSNYPEVVRECKELLADDPQDVQAHRFLIRAAKQLGTLDAISDEYGAKLAENPADAVARFAHAYVRVQAREFDLAMPELKQALELDPNLEYVNYVIGWLHFNPLTPFHDVDAAFEAWNRETALNPSSLGSLQVYRDLGGYYESRGQFELAREQIRAFRDNAFSEGDRVAARDLLERLKQHELEVVQAQQEADAPDASAEILIQYGSTLFQWQRQSEAITYWERARALQPENAELENYLGIAHMELHHKDEAIAAFTHALALRADFPDPHYNLAFLYDAEGDYPEALKHYERYLELQPFSAEAEIARKRVDEMRSVGSASDGTEAEAAS